MIELLVVLLVVAAYALGRARDERDRLLLRLCEVRASRWPQREHWHAVEQQLVAERLVWREAATAQQAAREAMHHAVASATRVPPVVPPPASSIAWANAIVVRWRRLPLA